MLRLHLRMCSTNSVKVYDKCDKCTHTKGSLRRKYDLLDLWKKFHSFWLRLYPPCRGARKRTENGRLFLGRMLHGYLFWRFSYVENNPWSKTLLPADVDFYFICLVKFFSAVRQTIGLVWLVKLVTKLPPERSNNFTSQRLLDANSYCFYPNALFLRTW